MKTRQKTSDVTYCHSVGVSRSAYPRYGTSLVLYNTSFYAFMYYLDQFRLSEKRSSDLSDFRPLGESFNSKLALRGDISKIFAGSDRRRGKQVSRHRQASDTTKCTLERQNIFSYKLVLSDMNKFANCKAKRAGDPCSARCLCHAWAVVDTVRVLAREGTLPIS